MSILTKQLKQLCIVENCFIHEGRLYERLYDNECKLKFRFMINEDDYDYVDDFAHERKLIRVFNKLKRGNK